MHRSSVLLPGPRPAEDHDDLALVDLHVDALQHLQMPEGLVEVLDPDDDLAVRRGHSGSARRPARHLDHRGSPPPGPPPGTLPTSRRAGRDVPSSAPLESTLDAGAAPRGRSPCSPGLELLWKNVKIAVSTQ